MSETARSCCGPDCCGDEPVTTLERGRTEAAAPLLAAQEVLRDEVRAKYGAAAKRAASGQNATGGGGTSGFG